MKLLDTLVLRGPNSWSIERRQLIVLKLGLQSSDCDAAIRIPRHPDMVISRLSALFDADFARATAEVLVRQQEAESLTGYLVARIALQLQRQVGAECWYTTAKAPDVKYMAEAVFEYAEEEMGLLASGFAIKITESLWRTGDYDIGNALRLLEEAWQRARSNQLSLALTTEAIKRNIPCIPLNKRQLVQLGYGANQKRIQTTHTDRTSILSMKITGNKQQTKELLSSFGVPVPSGKLITEKNNLLNAIKRIGYPVVLKPVGGNNGNGVSVNISNEEEAIRAFEAAERFSGRAGVIVEQFITGSDYRLLVINHQLVAAAKRTPAMVTGNGISTIAELMEIANSDPRRGTGHSKPLTIIKADGETLNILQRNGLTLQTVLAAGKIQFLKSIANLSVGGTSADVTDLVHPHNVFMAERISRIVGLDICGMDIISPDIAIPFHLNDGSVVEVNSGPGLRLHMEPTEGKPRNAAGSIIDMLFPGGIPSRIPIIAVAGSGKSMIASDLIEQLMVRKGYKLGSATSRGIYSQNFMVYKGDATGYTHAELVLKDPAIDLAVFECSLPAIYEGGLAFINCDTGIVIDLDTSDPEMARAAGVIPGCVLASGYAILNADNESVYQMHKGLECNIAYFSVVEDNPRILEHLKKGGYAAIVENEHLTWCHGLDKIRVISLNDVPAAWNTKYPSVIQNMLAILSVGAIYQIDVATIRDLILSR